MRYWRPAGLVAPNNNWSTSRRPADLLRDNWKPCAVLLMAVLGFWAWAGFSTLSPSHIGWVMSGWDTPAQYLGWEFFRYSPWQWPPGMNPAYGANAPGSIVLADCIPLLAIPLKLFSAWLPAQFQYFGIWILSCFILQAWFAYLLIRRVCDYAVIQLAGAGSFPCGVFFRRTS